jgi:predicted aspartyl protease
MRCAGLSPLFGLGLIGSLALSASERQTPQTSATVPLDVGTNCAIVQLGFVKPDGSIRLARFVVDTGGGAFLLAEPLANDIAVRRGEVMKSEEGAYAPIVDPPAVRLGAMPIDLSGVRAAVMVGAKRLGARDDAEGLLPGHLLQKYHVIFDYPAATFTMAKPGTISPVGDPVPAPIGRTGFPRIELTVAGETNGFLLDTGATYTMISQVVLDRWAKAQPSWPRATGAVGMANMFGGKIEATATMLRLGAARLGSHQFEEVAAVSRPLGTFEKFMSNLMSSPIVGAIGGNMLKMFRVEIDYANGVVYLQKTGVADPHDVDAVGLTLSVDPAGTVTISAVSSSNAPSVIKDLRPGDRLRQIDDRPADGQPLSALQRALAGKPGDVKTLVIERAGQQLTVKAVVSRIL